MIENIRKSRKPILICLLSEIEGNVRTISNRNLRMIMLHTNQSDIGQLAVSGADKPPYLDLAEDKDWITGMLQLPWKREERVL